MLNARTKGLAAGLLMVLLVGCSDDGDDGTPGAPGAAGAAGTPGLTSLTRQTSLAAGSARCPAGGVLIESGIDSNANSVLDADEVTATDAVCSPIGERSFNRIASFPVCSQIDATCNDGTETAAEIVAVSNDGLTLIYSDSPLGQVGFVDITDPENPVAAGTLTLAGEPTSVAVVGGFAVVGVNTSTDFVNVDGELAVVDIASQTLVTSIDMAGQPDSVAVSPDGAYIAVVIENERDEDLGDGAPPQLPAGELVIVDVAGAPAAWTTRRVDLTGTTGLYPSDPEPEYVDINAANVAVLTMQENNHIVLVDLPSGTILDDFTAGAVDLTQIDATEEDPALILQTESQAGVLREPDGVTWLNESLFVTADEGDLDGGSRGFTVFNTNGNVVFSSGNTLDHLAARLGHYPDARSGNKGNEPENAEFAVYGNENYLFVNSERSSLVFVYDVADPANPRFKQALPAGVGPEGALAIPSRNLLVVASEEDSRDDLIRSVVNIYRLEQEPATYPSIVSADRTDGTPIPWSALSGLAADPQSETLLYTVEDSFYGQNRIMTLDVSTKPALLRDEIRMTDANGVFAAIPAVALADDTVPADDPSRADVFDEADLAALINTDNTVNIDPEGISVASDGGFWIVSEGSGTVGDAGRPVTSLNFLIRTDAAGVITDVVTLPDAVNAGQLRFGFEGVAESDGNVYVAFQRVWSGLGDTNVRLGVYDITAQSWTFLFYPLDAPESQNGGWVGLSDLTAIGGGQFLVLERDNQGGPDAAIKRIYQIDVTGLSDGDTVTKTLVRDILPDLLSTGGLAVEKVEGMARTISGDVYINNDNDGVDDNSGETRLVNLGDIL